MYDDDYGLVHVEPLGAGVRHEERPYVPSQPSIRVLKELERISKKIDDMSTQWKSFVDYIKNIGNAEEEPPAELTTIVKQNEEIIKLNQKIMEILESINKKVDQPIQTPFIQRSVTPRAYPKIRIVK